MQNHEIWEKLFAREEYKYESYVIQSVVGYVD